MPATLKKRRKQTAAANKAKSRQGKQHKQDVERCRARYKKANEDRKAFMASDAARFIVDREWKRSLADMVPSVRLARYRMKGVRKIVARKISRPTAPPMPVKGSYNLPR